jgi:hypothetical protein
MSRTVAGLVLLLALAFAAQVIATTWGKAEKTCPVCQAKVEVQEIASYGSYIYRWPSRLRLLFWPLTDPQVLYFCPKCHLSLLMGDFKPLPEERLAAVRAALAEGKQAQPEKPYGEIPMAYRLARAEAAYRALGRDDAFWARFHRMAAYHLEQGGAPEALQRARTEALAAADRLLAARLKEPPAKESHIVRAGLLHQLGRKAEALAALETARATPFEPAGKLDEAQVKNATGYLTEVIDELAAKIQAGEPLPR